MTRTSPSPRRPSAHSRHRAERAGPAARALSLLQLGFPVWAMVELATGHTGDAVALVVMFIVLQAPRLLGLPLVFDAAFLVVWTLQALGQVAGFWSLVPWWDTLVHGALPATLAPVAYFLLVRIGVLPDLLARPGARARAGGVMVCS